MMNRLRLLFALLISWQNLISQTAGRPAIPVVLDGISYNKSGNLIATKTGQVLEQIDRKETYSLSKMKGTPGGAETGITLDISKPGFNGTVAYGPYNDASEYPTIAFLPKDVKMQDGKALLEFKKTFTRANDFFKLADKGKGIIGYRIMDSLGRIIYEGRVAFEGQGPYKVVPAIIEGPMINKLTADGCTISFETSVPVITNIAIGNKSFSDNQASTHHEIIITGLNNAKKYNYKIAYGNRIDSHYFKTAPKEGSRKPFTFAFTGATRATTGGGERDFGGVNYQATRAIAASALLNNAAFIQVQGDVSNGGNPTEDGHLLEYANLKRALEPFWFKVPVYVGFGDHEPNKIIIAADSVSKRTRNIELFPYDIESGEATFSKAFVNPLNGPQSEDGSAYDPNPATPDFPTYKENVYYYIYDNVAMIVLNTEYWESKDPFTTSGCPEGYIMDQQVKWLGETIGKMEVNAAIDHVFVVVHGAVFPNGDHLADAMWWNGENKSRAVVAGKPLMKGAIERRDEIIDICVNKSKKFVAFISGDEHNFSFLKITPQTNIYAANYKGPRIKINRSFYNINNGAGGSAPYAMLASPWSDGFNYFTEPPVLSLISVNGKEIRLKAIKIETMEIICDDVRLK